VLLRILRPLLVIAVISAPFSFAVAQQRTELDQLRKPTTVASYWAAVKSEIGFGKFDSAAEYLKGLLALNPTDKDLLALEEKDGIAAFLDLNNIARWSNNEAVDKEAKENVTKLITQITAAVKKLRADPQRIQKFIRNLTATPEEHDYAFIELRKAGAAVMPQLIGTMQNADLQTRAAIVAILPSLDPETVPALLAAFDIANPTLRVDFINVIQSRRDVLELQTRSSTDPRPTLWWLAAGNDLVASKAKNLLVALTETPLVRLPASAGELLKAAENMYQHRNTFSKQSDITLWKYDGRQLVGSRATPTQAEEYFGLRYSRWALEVEPGGEAAQVEFLSIALEKALERVGFEDRVSKSAPAVHELLAVAPATVLYTMLDRALKENHPTVAMGVAQVLGERAETHGKGSYEPLVKALNNADRRVALAAADALIRLPGNVGAQSAARIVEVYRSALATTPGVPGNDGAAMRPRALIADPNELRSKLFSEVVEQAGYEAVVTRTGRETLRRLALAGDIDVVWVNHELVYPTLPDFLAQARTDYRYGKLPLFVTVSIDMKKGRLPDIDGALDRLEFATRGWLIDETNLDEATKLARKLQNNGNDKATESTVRRRFTIERNRFPVRIDFNFDALKINNDEMVILREWLTELKHEHPEVRQTTFERQRVLITMTKQMQGLNDRLQTINAGLDQVVSRRVSDTLFVLELPTSILPDVLSERLAVLLRDYAYETVEGVRSRTLVVQREVPTTISLTSLDAPPPQRPGSVEGASTGAVPARPDEFETGYNPDLERDKIARAVSPTVEHRLRSLIEKYRNIELVAEPLSAAEVFGAMRNMQFIAGPGITPLSEAERKDHQRRAIDALRRMAIGELPGYDVRPATREILDAIRSDDLAPAAIEAASRLGGKDPQHALADVVVNTSRPAAIRKQATDELVRNIQKFGATSITDAQIATMLHLVDEEKSADVKAGIAVVVGALPRDRVLTNFGDARARDAWQRRLLNYQPPTAAPAAPMGEGTPKAEDK
jgi:CheY-like chemotaxis protein